MSEIFERRDVEDYMREEVAAAGGARKWLKKNKLLGYEHVLHMIENGTAATTPAVLDALGFRRVERFEPIPKPR